MQLRQERPAADPVSRDEERRELAAVLSHVEIARSANMVRMLTFICEKYFADQAEEIRESCIAVQALGRREASFDSQADPIVRVTARMLRKRLDAYYRSEGDPRAVRLELPVGRYVPRFVRIQNNANSVARAAPPCADANTLSAAVPEPVALRSVDTMITACAEDSARTEEDDARPHKHGYFLIASIAAVVALLVASAAGYRAGRASASEAARTSDDAVHWGAPLWADEFDGPAGAAPDPANWNIDAGNNEGWGNHESQVYCAAGSNIAPCDARAPNVFQDGNGHLVLRAIRTATGQWTSARVNTLERRHFLYGRIEARMKLPVGKGLWPAFWMMGDGGDAGWPQSGSVDFVENVSSAAGLGPSTIRSTIHGPGYSLGNGLYQNYLHSHGGRIDEFHVYGAIWSPNMIQFYVDDPANVFFVRTANDVPAGSPWVLNHPLGFVANLAVGGTWPGPPDASTPSPSQILIDYVRVYPPPPVPAPRISAEAVVVQAGSSGSVMLSLTAADNTGRVFLDCASSAPNTRCSPATAVVDFTNTHRQDVSIAVATMTIAGTRRFVAPAGDHVLTFTASSIGGYTSVATIPLRIK